MIKMPYADDIPPLIRIVYPETHRDCRQIRHPDGCVCKTRTSHVFQPVQRDGSAGYSRPSVVTVPGQAVAADIFHDVFSETSSRKTRMTTCIIHLHGLLLLLSVSGITPNHTRHNIDFAGCQVAPAGTPGGRWFQAGPPRRAGVQVRPGLFRETGTGVPPAWMPWMPAWMGRLRVWRGAVSTPQACLGGAVRPGLAFGSDRP